MSGEKIQSAVLAAIGLLGAACTQMQTCLSMSVCLDQVETDEPQDTGDTFAVCLSTVDSDDTACDSADTGCGSEDTDEARSRRSPSLLERSDLRRRLGREGVLPGDVLDRLNRE